MRDWWLRTLLVLQRAAAGVRRAARRLASSRSPTAPSRCSRSCCSPGSPACSRPRPPGACSTTHDYDGLLVAVWAFLAGGLYGGFAYCAFGALLYGGVHGARLAGLVPARAPRARVRRRADRALARALAGEARALRRGRVPPRRRATPGAGGDRLRRALGSRSSPGRSVLLVIGVRAVHGWTWSARSAGACGDRASSLPVAASCSRSARSASAASKRRELLVRDRVRVLLLRERAAAHVGGVLRRARRRSRRRARA